MAALNAKLSDRAVLPTPGRAARIIISPFWKPWVRIFNLGKPVGVPVTAASSVVAFKTANSLDNSSVITFEFWKSEVRRLSVISLSFFSASFKKSFTEVIS